MSLVIIRRFVSHHYITTVRDTRTNATFTTDVCTIDELLAKDLLRTMHVRPVHGRSLYRREVHLVRPSEHEYAAIMRNAGGRFVATGSLLSIETMLRTLAAHDLLCPE